MWLTRFPLRFHSCYILSLCFFISSSFDGCQRKCTSFAAHLHPHARVSLIDTHTLQILAPDCLYNHLFHHEPNVRSLSLSSSLFWSNSSGKFVRLPLFSIGSSPPIYKKNPLLLYPHLSLCTHTRIRTLSLTHHAPHATCLDRVAHYCHIFASPSFLLPTSNWSRFDTDIETLRSLIPGIYSPPRLFTPPHSTTKKEQVHLKRWPSTNHKAGRPLYGKPRGNNLRRHLALVHT